MCRTMGKEAELVTMGGTRISTRPLSTASPTPYAPGTQRHGPRHRNASERWRQEADRDHHSIAQNTGGEISSPFRRRQGWIPSCWKRQEGGILTKPASEYTEGSLFILCFGFSTKEEVSSIGRGVGMDVVKKTRRKGRRHRSGEANWGTA